MKIPLQNSEPIPKDADVVERVEWHKQLGDKVQKDELVLEFESMKGIDEVFASQAGIITEICYPDGSNPKRQEGSRGGWFVVFGYIETEIISNLVAKPTSESDEVDHQELITALEEPKKPLREIITNLGVGLPSEDKFLKAAPYVRKIAKERGIDLNKIQGSGHNGIITLSDLDAGRPTEDCKSIAKQEAQDDCIIEPLSSRHKAIARNMTQSGQCIIQASTGVRINFHRLLSAKSLLHEMPQNCFRNEALRYLRPDLFVMYGIILELKNRFHKLNSCYGCKCFGFEGLKVFRHINLGVAYDGEDGITVPVLHYAEECADIIELGDRYAELSQKVSEERLTQDDLRGGTLTFNNVGAFKDDDGVPFGADDGNSVVIHGQSVIITLHRIGKRASDDYGYAMLKASFDHRAHARGKPIIHFLCAVRQHVENFDYDKLIGSFYKIKSTP